jgi:alkanesulfonate monooxygenase SsuD/methylene tetrahydromethanopterin reductase-like flavin-dependent oxidoreductase (luciferase family)
VAPTCRCGSFAASTFAAQSAAELGLPYAFASHFALELLGPAQTTYRDRFKPSDELDQLHAMVGVHIIAADTDEQARRPARRASRRC